MAVLILAILACTVASSAAVTRVTEYGKVEGINFTLHNGGSVQSFLGIPFARPPVGPLRFKHPKKAVPWSGTLNATYPRASCWGVPLQWLSHTDPLYDDFSEDCLTMNIYTPGDAEKDKTNYAVMAWLHGGGYIGSGNVMYPGQFLAANGVIVVMFQYRLGPFGFLTTEDENAPGNAAMYDQIMALKFIQDNIANFGGNPGMVTLFGQSAGASSAGLHILSPLTEGLFHQVIAESGSDLAPWAIVDPNENPRNYAIQLVENLNNDLEYKCPTDDMKAMVECLQTAEPYEILLPAVFGIEEVRGYITHMWAPTVDGPTGFLPDRPITLREQGKYKKLPVMTGQTTEDGSLYLLVAVGEAKDGGFNRTMWNNVIKKLLNQLTPSGTNYEAAARALDFEYSNWPHIDDADANRQRMVELFTDVGFGIGNDLLAKSHCEYNATYQYLLGYRSPNITEEELPSWMGVTHNAELPYVLGWPFIKKNPEVKYQLKGMEDVISYDENDEVLANNVMKMWTNFAKYGNPTPTPVAGATWEKYDKVDYKYLYIGNDMENRKEYNQHRLAFWTQYAPWLFQSLSSPSPIPTMPSKTSITTSPETSKTVVTSTSNTSPSNSGQKAVLLSGEGETYRIATIALGVACGILLLCLLAALWKKSKSKEGEADAYQMGVSNDNQNP